MSDDTEGQRPKRQRRDTSYKSKAFEKFKQLKSGARNKYEDEEVENVFEVVDEKEYTKRVLDRQDDDWIVDDDGSGYVEDGRDIFDDDLDAESLAQSSSKKKGVKRKKNVADHSSKSNLKLLLSNMPAKKKEEKKLDSDDMLSELLDEIDQSPSCSTKETKKFIPRKQVANDYLKNFSLPRRKTQTFKDSWVKYDDLEEPKKEIKHISFAAKKLEIEETVSQKPEESCPIIETPDTQDDFDDAMDFDMSQIEEIESQTLENTVAHEAKEPEFTTNDFESEFLTGSNNVLCETDSFTSSIGSSDVPFVVNNGNKVFRFFWWDAFEDPEKQKGAVFLFGKTYCEKSKNYTSCCVAVKNLLRRIFLLPRPFILDANGKETDQPVTFKDVYLEFKTLVADKMQIKNFKAKFVQKKYAFDASVPRESDYLEVLYPATDPRINLDMISKTPTTFSRIFGINTSNLEKFLLDNKIKGPCWLDVCNPEVNNNPLSFCKFEVNCNAEKYLSKAEANVAPPPLVVSALNFRHCINPKTNQNEIVMVTCVTHSSYGIDRQQPNPPFNGHFCVIRAPSGKTFPLNIHETLKSYKGTRVQKMDSEKALINYFITQLNKIDPDLIVGHDLQGFQIDVLANRIIKTDVASFSKLSRLKRFQKKRLERELFTGRLVCDVKISAKELIKSRSYDLDTLCQQILKISDNQRVDLEPDEIPKMYDDCQNVVRFISITMQDTAFILKILYDLKIVPLALQITSIAGNVMSKTLMGGRSERNEFLLLHAFNEKNYIMPDKAKYTKKDDAGRSRKKPTYSGGLVLDPKVGFYDKLLLLMDFNSLYPSIIQEYNICFTTLPVSDDDKNLVLPDSSLQPGILPVEIRKLVDSRRQVKGLMANPELATDLKMQYNIRQMALKLTANSMYGCLGFANSRFYAKNLAALVTQKGREVLMNTKDMVERMCYEVVYGDTDSIMINSNMLDYNEVWKIGNKIKQEVNKLYKMVELDIDGVFKYLLLLKKKKYAAVTITRTKDGKLKEEKEYKGLDIVRRDWSQLASEAGKFVLEHILSDQTQDEKIENIQNYLAKIKDDLQADKVPLTLLIITKQLTKDPFMYPNKEALPHVQVALRYNKDHGGHFRAGDTVCYVICEDGTTNSATQRAYHIEELKSLETLKIDTNYYLAQQIHPVVARICDPIDGIDAYQIALCLGLSGEGFKKPLKAPQTEVGENITKPEIKFRNVTPFKFNCLTCGAENVVKGAMHGEVPFLLKCANGDCGAKPYEYIYFIQNQLSLAISSYISKYYQSTLICEDPACPNETRRTPLMFAGKYPVCTLCAAGVMYRNYTERELFTQLTYFSYIFDLNNSGKRPLVEAQVSEGYHILRETVQKYINRSGYAIVDLTDLFDYFMGHKEKEHTLEMRVPIEASDGLTFSDSE